MTPAKEGATGVQAFHQAELDAGRFLIQRCGDCSHQTVIGSYDQLFAESGREKPADVYDRGQFDPHRPSIDEFTWPCRECGSGTMQRV